jgi:hypothetical protein
MAVNPSGKSASVLARGKPVRRELARIRDDPAVGGNEARARMRRQHRLQGSRERIVVSDERAQFGGIGRGLRGIERADADAIGRELARDAQLDAIAGAIFLHRAGEMIGQRRRIALRGRVERTGRGADQAIAPRRAAFLEHERDVVAARTARIGGIEARASRRALRRADTDRHRDVR